MSGADVAATLSRAAAAACGEGIMQLGSFARSIIIARALSPTQFGVAAILSLVMYLLEMTTNAAVEKLLIQSPDGDSEKFQNTAHLFQALRGLLSGALIWVTAGPVASLFNIPDARWALQGMAIVPVLTGFAHTDIFRFQRHMRYGPALLMNVVGALIVTIAALPLALWLRSFAAVLWILVLQAGVTLCMTHLIARRSYRWDWDWLYIKRIVRFGWPLIVNGALMYVILAGDRLAIGLSGSLSPGSHYMLAELAAYSLASSLTLMPAAMISNWATSFFLPLLSRSDPMTGDFAGRYWSVTLVICVAASAAAIPLILAGDLVIRQMYGAAYSPGAIVVAGLAAMQGIRIMRVAPVTAAMALGDTKTVMVANVVRTSGVAGVVVVAALGYPLFWFPVAGSIAELLSLSVCLWRLQASHGVKVRYGVQCGGTVVLGLAIAGCVAVIGGASGSWRAAAFSSILILALLSLVMVATSPRGLRLPVGLDWPHKLS